MDEIQNDYLTQTLVFFVGVELKKNSRFKRLNLLIYFERAYILFCLILDVLSFDQYGLSLHETGTVDVVDVKQNIPIRFNTNYHREMKLTPINMDYCLFQFYSLKFIFKVSLHGDLYLSLNFSMTTPKFA